MTETNPANANITSTIINYTESTKSRAQQNAKRVCWCFLRIISLLLAVLMLGRPSPSFADAIKLCAIDQHFPPYVFKDETKSGIQRDIIFWLKQRLKIDLHVEHLPWKRCLMHVEQGLLQGVLGASHNPEREPLLRYPLADNLIDKDRHLYTTHTWLYVIDDRLRWDGKNLEIPSDRPVGTGLGYAIASALRDRGVQVAEKYDQRENFDWLLRRGLAAVAGYEEELAPILGNEPRYAGIRRLSPAFQTDVQYIAFNHAWYQKNARMVEDLWTALQALHKAGEYEKIYQKNARYLVGQ
jgi:polar amino acid transport system substrate-binding protein